MQNWIYSSVTQSINVVLVGSLTIRNRWVSLKELSNNTTQSRIMLLHGRLQTLAKNDLSVNEYLLRAKIIADYLVVASELVHKEEFYIFSMN